MESALYSDLIFIKFRQASSDRRRTALYPLVGVTDDKVEERDFGFLKFARVRHEVVRTEMIVKILCGNRAVCDVVEVFWVVFVFDASRDEGE